MQGGDDSAQDGRGDDDADPDDARANDPAKIIGHRHVAARNFLVLINVGRQALDKRGKNTDAANISAMPMRPPSAENTTAQPILYATSFITVPFWLKQQSDKSCRRFCFERNYPARFCNDSLACRAFNPSRQEKQAECTPARKGTGFPPEHRV